MAPQAAEQSLPVYVFKSFKIKLCCRCLESAKLEEQEETTTVKIENNEIEVPSPKNEV